jgi:DNA-binding Lrp family transcriptional regulator
MVTALVFIRTVVDTVNDVAESIAAIDGVSEVYSVTGDLDLVALVRVRHLDDVSAVVTDGVAKVPGILTTETHVAFRTYSRHDLESAFSLGLD